MNNCDDTSDEDEETCGTIRCENDSSLTFSCKHPATNITICASRCNGVTECYGGLDEKDCSGDSMLISIIVLITLTFLSVFWNAVVANLVKGTVEHPEKFVCYVTNIEYIMLAV